MKSAGSSGDQIDESDANNRNVVINSTSRNEGNMSRNESRRLSGNSDRPLDSMSSLSPIKSHSPQRKVGAVRLATDIEIIASKELQTVPRSIKV